MDVRKIQRSGNSVYVTLHRNYLTMLGLKQGDFVIIRLGLENITISPLPADNLKGKVCRKKSSKKSR